LGLRFARNDRKGRCTARVQRVVVAALPQYAGSFLGKEPDVTCFAAVSDAVGLKYETPDSLGESGVFLYGSQAVEVFLTAVLELFEIGELFVRGICNKFLGLIREAFEIFVDHYSSEGNAYFLQTEK
jgi:hypothetical protein